MYGTDKIRLTDLGLYGVEIYDTAAAICPSDTCTLFSEYNFRLREKQWATSYSGEYVYASFDLSDGSFLYSGEYVFDSTFSLRYVLLPGSSTTTQVDWTPDWMYYDVATQTLEWMW